MDEWGARQNWNRADFALHPSLPDPDEPNPGLFKPTMGPEGMGGATIRCQLAGAQAMRDRKNSGTARGRVKCRGGA